MITFLRKFGVKFWALAGVFGGDPMFWYRMECGLGRFSVVGTTVRTATLPEHLLADEHHQVLDGQEGLHRHDRRQRVLPGSGTGRGGRERRVEGRLPTVSLRNICTDCVAFSAGKAGVFRVKAVPRQRQAAYGKDENPHQPGA